MSCYSVHSQVPCLFVTAATTTKRVFSGIQPTGAPHLGNYLGALRWWVDFQDRYDALYCVVDLHALTVPGDPEELSKATVTVATLLLAAGLDPARCILFVQSHVPEHAELTWLLECTASMGELGRMTQFKDKAAKGGRNRLELACLPTRCSWLPTSSFTMQISCP